MADKKLSASEWKAFSKGKGLADAKLIAALTDLDRARDPDDCLEALDDLDKQIEVIKKAAKGDKPVLAYLDDVDTAAGKARKAAEAEAEAAANPALLTTELLPLIRAVRGGATMPALIAVLGMRAAVLISKRAISPTRRELLKTYLGASSGVHFLPSQALLEDGKLTFAVEGEIAGLAKKLTRALLEQCALRLKLRVRDAQGAAEEDGEDGDGTVAGTAAATAESQARETESEDDSKVSPEAALFAQRYAAIDARVQALPADAGAAADKVRALLGFADGKAKAQAYGTALQALDQIEKLLHTLLAAQPVVPGADAEAFKTRLDALMVDIKAAIAAGGSTATDIKLKFSEAGALARARDYPAANGALDAIEQLLAAAGAGSSSGSASGTTAGTASDTDRQAGTTSDAQAPRTVGRRVAQRQFLITRWKKIPDELRGKFGELCSLLADQNADDNPQELVDAMQASLDLLLEGIQDQIDDAINKDDTRIFQGLRDKVSGNGLIALLRRMPSFDGTQFETALLTALDEVETAMTR